MNSPVYRAGDCYAFRITHSYDTFPPNFFEHLMSYAEGLLVVEHKEEGKRTHIHAALLNAKVSHKRIKQIIQSTFSQSITIVEQIKGAGNFSLKKWDTQVRYLVYMLKGKYTFLFNSRVDDMGCDTITWIIPQEEERLRQCWKSESVIENEYSGFKASKYWPIATLPTVKNAVLDDAFWASDHGVPRTETPDLTDQQRFAEVRKCCINYILGKYGGFITPKNRYLIKDLISNFCLFNDIKMLPVHI